MAIATFIKTGLADKTGSLKSQAVMSVDGKEVLVEFWYELIEQWGKDGAKTFLCAEALWKTENYQDAVDLLSPDATGSVGKDKLGNPTDTRNWQQNWIDGHPIPATLAEPAVDPLA